MHEVLESGQFVGGKIVRDFEREWSNFVGSSHAVGVANGLDAITLALRALGIGAGDFVAVPSHTFIATWLAVLHVGATPVGIDVDEFGLMNLDELESSTSSFAAVVPVHLHGSPVDMKRLMAWAEPRGIRVVEDCAQAHGAVTSGRQVGTWGDAGAFSFYPTKNLGALGDAGLVVSNSFEVTDRIRELGNYGSSTDDKYHHKSLGFNSRLDPIQAAVLNVNLVHLEAWNRRRKDIAQKYLNVFSGIDTKQCRPLPQDESTVWHHFVIQSRDRSAARRTFDRARVSTEIHYPNLAQDEVSELFGLQPSPQFANARRLSNQVLSIPLNQWMTDQEVERVIDVIATL